MIELNKSSLPYAVTGATAASYYGIPRTTADIDFIVRVASKQLPRFIATLQKSDLKVNPVRIKRQLKTGYNVISLQDNRSQYRADFIVQHGKIERRKGSMLGLPAYYQTPESLILAKLRMIKATVSPEKSFKDRNDIRSILTNTSVNTRKIQQKAKRESTLEIFESMDRPD